MSQSTAKLSPFPSWLPPLRKRPRKKSHFHGTNWCDVQIIISNQVSTEMVALPPLNNLLRKKLETQRFDYHFFTMDEASSWCIWRNKKKIQRAKIGGIAFCVISQGCVFGAMAHGDVNVWDAQTGLIVQYLQGTRKLQISQMSVFGDMLITVGAFGINVYNWKLALLKVAKSAFASHIVILDNEQFVTSSVVSNQVVVRSMSNGDTIHSYTSKHEGHIKQLFVDRSIVYTVSEKSLCAYDLQSQQFLYTVPTSEKTCNTMLCPPYIIIRDFAKHSVVVRDMAQGTIVYEFALDVPHAYYAVCANSIYFVMAGDQQVHVWRHGIKHFSMPLPKSISRNYVSVLDDFLVCTCASTLYIFDLQMCKIVAIEDTMQVGDVAVSVIENSSLT